MNDVHELLGRVAADAGQPVISTQDRKSVV